MGRAVIRMATCMLLGAVLLLESGNGRADAILEREIPAQPLATALAEFAHQTGLQLVYLSDVLKDQKSRGAQAGVPTADALAALLEGTGLTFEFLNDRAVRIFPTPRQSSRVGPTPIARQGPGATVLDEIDVTGQRDERVKAFEYLQDVPVPVTVLSGASQEALKSEQLLDYAASVPGMSVVTPGGPGQSQLIIRGIFPFNGSPALASYIDDAAVSPTGIYAYAANLTSDLIPYDVERFEVWRGPQGTSVGAENEMGIVRYVLFQPDLREFHATVAADALSIHGGDRPGGSAYGAVSVPILAERLALRLSGYDSYLPGYIDNLYNGAKGINPLRRYGARIAALWRPSDALAVTVNVLRKSDSTPNPSQVTFDQVGRVPDTGTAWFAQSLGSWGDLLDRTAMTAPLSTLLDLTSVSLVWTPGTIEVHSATAWTRIDNLNSVDATQTDGSFFPAWSNGLVPPGLALYLQFVNISKFSEELHVASGSGHRIEWTVGAFYTRESGLDNQTTQAFDTAYQPIAYFAPALSYSTEPSKFTEEVLLGNLTWHLRPRLDLAAGFRLAHDDQNNSFTSAAWNSPATSLYAQGSERTESWSGSAKYRISRSNVVYARVATGIQPGFPNVVYEPGIPPMVGAETAINYELGLKGEYLESRALVDLTLFYVDWKDISVAIVPNNTFYYANGAHGQSKGFELTSSFAPIPDLQLSYNAAFVQCALDNTIPAADYYLTDWQLPVTPKWAMSAAASYSWPLAGAWRALIGGTARWVGEQWNLPGAVQSYEPFNYPAVIMPAFWSIDVNAQASRGPLTLRMFIRNLTDERAAVNNFAILNASGEPVQVVSKLLQPRTIGVGVIYKM